MSNEEDNDQDMVEEEAPLQFFGTDPFGENPREEPSEPIVFKDKLVKQYKTQMSFPKDEITGERKSVVHRVPVEEEEESDDDVPELVNEFTEELATRINQGFIDNSENANEKEDLMQFTASFLGHVTEPILRPSMLIQPYHPKVGSSHLTRQSINKVFQGDGFHEEFVPMEMPELEDE
jgi:hypothetical protein